MNIIKGISNLIKKGYSPIDFNKNYTLTDASFTNLFRGTSVTQPYSQCVWVYAAISAIVQALSSEDLNVYVRQGDYSIPILAPENNEFRKLIENPNEYQTQQQFVESIFTYKLLRGESAIIAPRGLPYQVPSELQSVDPHRLKHLIKDGRLVGWHYVKPITGEVIPFATHEVLFDRFLNPYHPLRGLAPITAAAMQLEIDKEADVFNLSFFKEGAHIGGFIVTDEELTPEAYDRLLASLNDRHQGSAKSHRLGILEGNTEYKSAQLSQKDMDFISSKKLSRETILAVYKTNSVFLGCFEDVKSYEGTNAAMRMAWENSIVPNAKISCKNLTSQLIYPIRKNKYFIAFDFLRVPALLEAFYKKIDIAEKMVRLGYPINAINERLDLKMPKVGWGDIWWGNKMLIPKTEEAIEYYQNVEYSQEQPEVNETVTVSELALSKKIINTKASEPNLIEQHLALHSKIESEFKKKLGNYFSKQRKRTLKNLSDFWNKSIDGTYKTKGIEESIFDIHDETNRYDDKLSAIYELGVSAGAESIANYLGNSGFVFNPLDPEFFGFMSLKIKLAGQEINSTTKEQLRKELADGLGNGESTDQLIQRVKNIFNELSTTRLNNIARTEANSSINGGRVIEMVKEGVTRHTWLTAGDENVRVSHIAVDGMTVKIGETFGSTGLRQPGDPQGSVSEVAGCRCVTIPAE